MTRFEKIKNMDIDEMAKQLEKASTSCALADRLNCRVHDNCIQCRKKWLETEVE